MPPKDHSQSLHEITDVQKYVLIAKVLPLLMYSNPVHLSNKRTGVSDRECVLTRVWSINHVNAVWLLQNTATENSVQ